MADLTNTGTIVFLRIFEKKPEMKEYFPFKDCVGERLLKHSTFRNHTYRFEFYPDYMVYNLASYEARA